MDKQQWKLVPVNPTHNMLIAAKRPGSHADRYRAMLDAAPSATGNGGVDGRAAECERCGLAPEQHTEAHWCDNQSFALVNRHAAPSLGIDAPEQVPVVAWRIRYRSEPGMIGHYPWSYTDRIRGMRLDEQYEYEPLHTAAPAVQPPAAWKEYAQHLEWCSTCGEGGASSCHEGGKLHEAAYAAHPAARHGGSNA